MVKNLPANKETWVRPLGREAPLEEGTATHSGTLAWRIPWTEEPGGLQSMALQRVGKGQNGSAHAHTCAPDSMLPLTGERDSVPGGRA